MRNATGSVQSILVLGGNSDIANAIVDELARDRLQRVVLAVRDPATAVDRAADLSAHDVACEVVAYDANNPEAHDAVLANAGAIDLVVVAFGTLGDPYDLDASTESVQSLAHANFVTTVGATHAAARHLVAQGRGSLLIFSSVAGFRVRSANAIYGAAKAGLDGFAQALGDALQGTGVDLTIVRPGFVHTKMTEGMKPAPFATTSEEVAKDAVAGLGRGRRVVWSPASLRWVFNGLRVVPAPLWRRLG